VDGDIGRLKDALFDDEHWVIRYLVVETGGWRLGRRVLISPLSVLRVDIRAHIVSVNPNRRLVERSPYVDTDSPVTRQYGLEYLEAPENPMRSYLRSANEVLECQMRDSDDVIGRAEDLLFDAESWAIRFVVVATRQWWLGPHALVSPERIDAVNWREHALRVGKSGAEIQHQRRTDPDCQKALRQYYAQELSDPGLACGAYALRECFAGKDPIPITSTNMLGVLSLVFWTLISLKYMRYVLSGEARRAYPALPSS
jgi:hypothetical protein